MTAPITEGFLLPKALDRLSKEVKENDAAEDFDNDAEKNKSDKND